MPPDVFPVHPLLGTVSQVQFCGSKETTKQAVQHKGASESKLQAHVLTGHFRTKSSQTFDLRFDLRFITKEK